MSPLPHDERLRRFVGAGLYLVTSQSVSRGRTTPTVVEAALTGGVKLVQLREKSLSTRELHDLAVRVRALTAAHNCLLIINDRLDVALAVGADGVHLGQNDLPIARARALAPDLIVGASTHNIEEARRAQSEGASYLNIGPLFPTGTKQWTGEFLGLDGLRAISAHVSIPYTVMGGIKQDHIQDLLAAGAGTIDLVTAVTAADDPAQATRELLKAIKG